MSKLTKKQRSEIAKLASMADREIDTSEIPKMADWKNPVTGNFYRPVKKQGSGKQIGSNHLNYLLIFP